MSKSLPEAEKQIRKLWRAHYRRTGRKPHNLSGFGKAMQYFEQAALDKTNHHLQPWLAIMESELEWIGLLHIVLSSDNPSYPRQEFRSTWALTGSASAFGHSIRHLLKRGFDTPARALMRSYSESIFLCLAILADEHIDQQFQDSQSDEQCKTFWHQTISPIKLHKRVIDLEQKLGLDQETIEHFTAWRRDEYEVLSQSSHLSYIAAALTSTAMLIDDETNVAPAILGLASFHSFRTIKYFCELTSYFALYAFIIIFKGALSKPPLISLDNTNDTHAQLELGVGVIYESVTAVVENRIAT